MLIVLLGVLRAHGDEVMVTRADPLTFGVDRTGRTIISVFNELHLRQPGVREAHDLVGARPPASRPSMSENGRWLVYETAESPRRVMLENLVDGTITEIFAGAWDNRMPAISAAGDRILFSSNRDGDFDIWEASVDGSTLTKRSFAVGDELYPSFSRAGDLCVWIGRNNGLQRLMMARGYARATALFATREPLAAPSVRPGGDVIVFRTGPANMSQWLVLIDPNQPVVKALGDAGPFSDQRPLWLDPNRYLVGHNGRIQERLLGAGNQQSQEFLVWIRTPSLPAPDNARLDKAPLPHRGAYVVRVGEALLDDTLVTHRGVDLLIRDDRLVEISPVRDWPASIAIIDFGAALAIPGLVAIKRASVPELSGTEMLRLGYTSEVCLDAPCAAGSELAPYTFHSGIANAAQFPVGERTAEIERAREQGLRVLSDQLYPDLLHGANLLSVANPMGVSLAGGAPPVAPQTSGGAYLLLETAEQYLSARQGTRSGGGPWVLAKQADTRPIVRALLAYDRPSVLPLLAAASVNASHAFGIAGETGSLASGKLANLLVLRRSPNGDRQIAAIILGGHLLTPEGLDTLKHGASANFTKYGRMASVTENRGLSDRSN